MIMMQRTINNVVKATGISLHAGELVALTLEPAPVNSGITFIRTDLQPMVAIKATAENIGDTQLCSCLVQNGVRVSTIEHIMSAFAALGIDNATVKISASEVPIMDGSANPFVFLIQSAGITEQNARKKFIKIKRKIVVEDNGKEAVLEPFDGCCFDFTIEFDHPLFEEKHCHAKLDLSTSRYIKEISRARTFGFLAEMEYLRRMDLIRGGSLDNAIVVDNYRVLNAEGLRYEDEFVRHKILDAIGDLYLLGHSLIGAYHGFKSGHGLNNQLCRALLADTNAWELVSFEREIPIQFAPAHFGLKTILAEA
jgi:UDP-3-O-[3-hydroxymyristoyl] N-acetylglucosamine deacetylase